MLRALDALYRASGLLAAVFLVAIAVVVAGQVGLNVVDAVAGWLTGTPIGLVIPSYAEFAGYFLAASSFLGLAFALRAGAHIRVTMLLDRCPGRLRRLMEAACAGIGAAMAGYAAFYTVLLSRDSFVFGDTSPGLVAVPLWLPQAAMAAGLVVLTIALIHAGFDVANGVGDTADTDEDSLPVER
jgi:TRAP-type C4-dicarboxylate transport system permease small subunit